MMLRSVFVLSVVLGCEPKTYTVESNGAANDGASESEAVNDFPACPDSLQYDPTVLDAAASPYMTAETASCGCVLWTEQLSAAEEAAFDCLCQAWQACQSTHLRMLERTVTDKLLAMDFIITGQQDGACQVIQITDWSNDDYQGMGVDPDNPVQLNSCRQMTCPYTENFQHHVFVPQECSLLQ